MCTYTKSRFFRIAWKPITCYKVLLYIIDSTEEELRTPVMWSRVKLGEIVKTKILTYSEHIRIGEWIYTKNVIHSWVTYFDANRYLHEVIRANNIIPIIVKCTIPRFTRYQKDISGCAFISKRLKYEK